MNIVAVSPSGRFCGVALLGDGGAESIELPAYTAIRYVDGLLESGTANLVICANVDQRRGFRVAPKAGDPETIGALRYLCRKHEVKFELQSPAEAKLFAGARYEKLTALGWRRPSKHNHADDASAHLLVAAVKNRLVDPSKLISA